MSRRAEISKVVEMVKDTKAIEKLYEAIGECIYTTASNLAEEKNLSTDEVMVAVEEIIYRHTHTEEELAERLEDELVEQEAREWLCAEDDIDAETVANSIMGIHEGYRCEQEEVPARILSWAKARENGDR